MTICAYQVDCENILDLTDPATRAAHHITPWDLACPWKDLATKKREPPSWTIMRRLTSASAAGTPATAGIIVQSFATNATPADINIIFWTWQPHPPHQVKVIDDFARLPKDPTSRP